MLKLIAVGIALIVTACRTPGPISASDTSGVFTADTGCVKPSSERYAAVRAMVPIEMIVGFEGGAEPEVLGALAAMSDEALAWMVKQHQEHGFKLESVRPGNLSAMGVAIQDPETKQTKKVEIHPVLAGDLRINVVLHELGHVTYFRVHTPEFEARLNGVYEKEGKSWFVGKYAQSAPGEYFAEAFNTYYCSPAEALRLQKALPETYAFLRQYAGTPHWAGDGMPAPANGATSHLSATRPFIKNVYRLGVTTEDVAPTGLGIRITAVTPGSAADRHGLKVGDVPYRIENFQNLLEPNDLVFFVQNTASNQIHLHYKEKATGQNKQIMFLLDVVTRADDAPADAEPNLGACVGSGWCRGYIAKPFCDRLGQQSQQQTKWHVAKTCQSLGHQDDN